MSPAQPQSFVSGSSFLDFCKGVIKFFYSFVKFLFCIFLLCLYARKGSNSVALCGCNFWSRTGHMDSDKWLLNGPSEKGATSAIGMKRQWSKLAASCRGPYHSMQNGRAMLSRFNQPESVRPAPWPTARPQANCCQPKVSSVPAGLSAGAVPCLP